MPQEAPADLPYCGAPPSPEALWSRWNLDPVLLLALVVLAGAYAAGAARLNRRHATLSRHEQIAFYAGWTIAAAALISPLCALSVSLFAARVGQHMTLALLASPLLAAGRPLAALRALLGGSSARNAASPATGLAATGLFAALLWVWHAPVPYALTFTSTPVYWAMHISMLAAAIWLWSTLLDRTPGRALLVVGAGVISSVQMGFLGALITFAPRALYAPHALTTAAWGLTPLADQQLGGAIMWVPGGVVFLAVAMLALRPTLSADAWRASLS